MDFKLTVEQQALADSVARFTARHYGFEARNALVRSPEGFDRVNWATFAELGWTGAGLSEAAGGYGGGPVENMILMEAFGRALVLEPFMPCAILSLQTLVALPASDRRDMLIAGVVGGEMLLALAHGEAAARGDLGFVETRIEGDRLYGTKSLVLGAPAAGRLLVSARSTTGVGLYLVDTGAAGSNLKPYRLLDNERAGDIVFDGVVAQELAAPDVAESAITTGYAHALVAICAEAVGAMEAAMLMTADYLRTRKQFGTSLNNFQALQHRMADMLCELEMSRSIVFQGIAALEFADSARRDRAISAMKAVVSTAAIFVGRNAVQLHGAIGMTEEYAIGHFYRRLFVIAAQFGNEAFHLKRMAAAPPPFWPEVDATVPE